MPDVLQRLLATVLLIPAAPVIAISAIALYLETRANPFHIAQRIGERGTPFGLVKLRTMYRGSMAGGSITTLDDSRITGVGRILRRRRIDELPQLWNVVRGQMRLVGPRPEAPDLVDWSNPLHRLVFTSKPGITGLTQLEFADEARLLDPEDPIGSYVERVLPLKVALDSEYLRRRSTALDLRILGSTVRIAVKGGERAERRPPPRS